MNSSLYTIRTTMEPDDYCTFLFIATFLRNPLTIPMIAGISLLGAVLSAWLSDSFSLRFVLIFWVILFFAAIVTICFKIQRKNKQRIQTDKTGTFQNMSILTFFDDHMMMETPSLQASCTLQYDQFYELLESKDYLIFYLSQNQASILPKKDIPNPNTFLPFVAKQFPCRYKRTIFAAKQNDCMN